MGQNEYGFPRLETWGKQAGSIVSKAKNAFITWMTIPLSAFLIMRDLASQCYLEQISSIFKQLRYFSSFTTCPPLYGFLFSLI